MINLESTWDDFWVSVYLFQFIQSSNCSELRIEVTFSLILQVLWKSFPKLTWTPWTDFWSTLLTKLQTLNWTHWMITALNPCNAIFSELIVSLFGKVSRGKLLFFFVQMRGGRALPKFFVTFSEMYFWSIKGVYFLQNANNLNFKLFFRLYTWPTKQVFCLYLRRILDL